MRIEIVIHDDNPMLPRMLAVAEKAKLDIETWMFCVAASEAWRAVKNVTDGSKYYHPPGYEPGAN